MHMSENLGEQIQCFTKEISTCHRKTKRGRYINTIRGQNQPTTNHDNKYGWIQKYKNSTFLELHIVNFMHVVD